MLDEERELRFAEVLLLAEEREPPDRVLAEEEAFSLLRLGSFLRFTLAMR